MLAILMYEKIKFLAHEIDKKKQQIDESKDLLERQLLREELRDLQEIYRALRETD